MKIKKKNILESTLTIRELAILCAEYDEAMGNFPESPYEGYSVFKSILKDMVNKEIESEGELYDIFNYQS